MPKAVIWEVTQPNGTKTVITPATMRMSLFPFVKCASTSGMVVKLLRRSHLASTIMMMNGSDASTP